MEVNCLAFPKSGCCRIVSPPKRPTLVIGGSVGAGGKNRPADVRTIQAALNDVPTAKGGPQSALSVDGIVGHMTLAAIKRFQEAHVRIVDSRVDPNGPTLAALNAELDRGVPIEAHGISAGAAARTPEYLPPDFEITVVIAALLWKVRDVIRAANYQINVADRFVGTDKLSTPTGPFFAAARHSLHLLDAIFSLGKFHNPRAPFENIKRVFHNMDVALNRTYETAPLIAPVLFVPNTHISMEKKSTAYTAAGGAFLTSQVKIKGLGEPADRIYVCRNFLTEPPVIQVAVLVHELAHFVSGTPISITHANEPPGHPEMFGDSYRAKSDPCTPDQKLRHASHYAFFAIVARFSQYLKEN